MLTFYKATKAQLGYFFFCISLFVAPLSAAGQSFEGFYVGIDASRQNTIAGALVAGIDMLAQSTRSVASLNLGYRMALPRGFVAGIDLGYGISNGDLSLNDGGNQLTINYKNSTQFGFGAQAGYVIGADGDKLLFLYLSETKRTFDVTIRGPLGVGRQQDEQGLLRYGVGIETHMDGPISIRAFVGTSRADFNNRRTNIVPKRTIDFGIGMTYQF